MTKRTRREEITQAIHDGKFDDAVRARALELERLALDQHYAQVDSARHTTQNPPAASNGRMNTPRRP